jgi:hypothetical protein
MCFIKFVMQELEDKDTSSTETNYEGLRDDQVANFGGNEAVGISNAISPFTA